jgi:hypothetical protein
VDELGGIREAIVLAKKIAGIGEKEEIELKEFPMKKSMIAVLIENLPLTEKESLNSSIALSALEMVRPHLSVLSELGLGPDPGVLSMFPLVYNIH